MKSIGKKIMQRVTFLVITFLFTSLAIAADQTQIVESRQANYREIGGSFKGITDELRKRKPLMVMVRAHSEQLQQFARDQAMNDWFPEGSGFESGLETAAKTEIWTQREGFENLQQELKVEVDALVTVVSSRDMDAVEKQNRVVGQVCKQCHEIYREEED